MQQFFQTVLDVGRAFFEVGKAVPKVAIGIGKMIGSIINNFPGGLGAEAIAAGDPERAEHAARENWRRGSERSVQIIESLGERGKW